jgi:pimeloyl-ACP methyl ester carboxylesterase
MLHYIFETALILLYIFVGVLLVNHVFTFAYLFIESKLGRLQDQQDYPTAPLWRYAFNCCLELFYVTGKFYLYPYKYLDLSINLNSTNSTAVLLIHGYARNQSDWLWFRKHIKDLSCPIYTLNLKPALASIEEIATKSLIPKIKQMQKQGNYKQIVLIGHSMGGLVASYYSEFLDEDKLVQNVFTIASPFYGTKLSVAAAGINAQQMCPGSKFALSLRSKLNLSAKKYYQVATQLDNIIFPWRSVLLENTPSSRQFIVPFESHLGLLHSKLVVQKIKEWIKYIIV